MWNTKPSRKIKTLLGHLLDGRRTILAYLETIVSFLGIEQDDMSITSEIPCVERGSQRSKTFKKQFDSTSPEKDVEPESKDIHDLR